MKKFTIPLAFSVIALLVYIILMWTLPDWIYRDYLKYLYAAFWIGLGIAIVRAIGYVLFDVIFRKRKGREAPELLRVLVSIAGYSLIFAFLFTFVLEKDLAGIFATSAVVSLILGLALQETLGNFFAGISLHVEQPFHIGDAIRIETMIGKVEAVTWRTTTIRTNDNTLIIFPNSRVARDAVEIFPYNNLNRRILHIPAPYGVPPQTVIQLIKECIRTLPNLAPERAPVVRIGRFADSSIDYEVLYWVKDYMWTPDMDAKMRERVWYAFHRKGIQIPFPIRHVLMEQVGAAAGQEEDYAEIIRQVSIFEPLGDHEKEEVARSLVRYVYAPGEMILRSGDQGNSMFIVHRGRVEVQLPSDNGKPQQLAVLGPGDFFGEMALFTGEPRTADVSALEEVEVLEIRKPVIEKLFAENSGLAEALSSKIADRQAELAQYTRAMPEDEKMMKSRNILARVKRFFSLK
ncbi:MAG TPA: mechanosensitive ion channel family protein [Blastocatellia bacterium]|nr:mechanosensitive ion channel family protein [Blastocatellia bacterium]